jgi:hypothetical protein
MHAARGPQRGTQSASLLQGKTIIESAQYEPLPVVVTHPPARPELVVHGPAAHCRFVAVQLV